MSKISVEYLSLSEIRAASKNPKRHAEEVLDESIERFGYVQPVTMNETTGELVAGHGRVEALHRRKAAGKPPPGRVEVREDGEWLVPVIRGISFANEFEAQAYLIADNRTSEVGGWDDTELRNMLLGISEAGENALSGLGFDAEKVSSMLAEAKLENLKVAPIAIAEENVGVDPRKTKYWVWATCPDEATMLEAIKRFGKNEKSRELKIESMLGRG